jgi:predicted transposase YdaD
MSEQIQREVAPGRAGQLWTATDILMGLRFERELVAELLKGVRGMKESVTYQAIIEEGVSKGREEGLKQGAVLEARKTILALGKKRLGQPDKKTLAAIEALDDLDNLEHICDRLLDVGTWQELLETL